jgi:hypothetical protein
VFVAFYLIIIFLIDVTLSMAVNYLNEIISIFLQRNVNELTDNDLSTTITTTDKVCSAEEIHRVVHSFGSSLFQLRCNKEGIFLVRIEPKVSFIEPFLCDLSCILDQYMSRISWWQMCF